MKIVQALGWYYPDGRGGTEAYVAGLSRRLRAAGHDVTIAAPSALIKSEQWYEHERIPVYRYPIARDATREECQDEVPVRGAERFHRFLAETRADVVHMHTFATGMGLHELRAAKASGARVIATTHSSRLGFICQRGTMMQWGDALCDGVSEPSKCAACALQSRGLPRSLALAVGGVRPELSERLGVLPGKIGTALGMSGVIRRNQQRQTEMLNLVDKFIVLTRYAFDVLIANGAPAHKVALNRLGVSQSNLVRKYGPDRAPTASPLKVGYVGRFEDVKGVRDLAFAATKLDSALPISIDFRGPSDSDAERALVAELKRVVGNDSRVTFSSAVPHSVVPQVLAAYDVLCCPARCLEGGPTVAIEAHAVGTPVIGSRIGGLAELITDGVNGRLVPPGDPIALANALTEAALDPRSTVDAWRTALPPARSMDEIAKDYLVLYAGGESNPAFRDSVEPRKALFS
jgi:glycosyltransferase involved in cell wall biosynthesis